MPSIEQNIVTKNVPLTFLDLDDKEQAEITNALTAEIAIKLQAQKDIVNNFRTLYLDAQTCLPEWLDTLASLLGWSTLWDSQWSVTVKRQLLANNDWLWSNRGTLRAIAKLFEIFELDAEISPISGFIAGTTQIPGQVGFDPFSYEIRANQDILEKGTPKNLQLNWVIDNFIPCWILLQIQTK